MAYKRSRLLYGSMLVIVIILGLLSRKITSFIPDIIDKYLGDALWAVMIFTGFGFIFRDRKTKLLVLLGISFCFLIEISQLYHALWIDNIRRTTLGGLVLGYGFLWSDLLAYAIGIGAAAVIDVLLRKFMKSHKTD